MPYQHRWSNGQPIELPVGKAVCVGRNYADHARELNNPVPTTPLLFIKPLTALVAMEHPLKACFGQQPCHFETELAVLVGEALTDATAPQALAAVAGVGLGLDLTLRGVQDELKRKGHPWELAKAFDGSCPLSPFVRPESVGDLEDCEYHLWVNQQPRQHGRTRQMITPIGELLAYCSRHFTLLPGDVVLTGTPAGVGQLQAGDRLKMDLAGVLSLETRVEP